MARTKKTTITEAEMEQIRSEVDQSIKEMDSSIEKLRAGLDRMGIGLQSIARMLDGPVLPDPPSSDPKTETSKE